MRRQLTGTTALTQTSTGCLRKVATPSPAEPTQWADEDLDGYGDNPDWRDTG